MAWEGVSKEVTSEQRPERKAGGHCENTQVWLGPVPGEGTAEAEALRLDSTGGVGGKGRRRGRPEQNGREGAL